MAYTTTYIEKVPNKDGESNNGEKKFPYKIEDLDEKTDRELSKLFTGEKTEFIQIGPKKWFLPSKFRSEAENYYNFNIRPDDVFITTFPRSGTTWTQEMVWLLANNLDYKKAGQVPLSSRFPFLEFSSYLHPEMKTFIKECQFDAYKTKVIEGLDNPGWKLLNKMTERRFIKTHLAFSLLPPNILDIGCKVIYVARNPKDVAVSFYHLNKGFRTQGFNGDFPEYWNCFQKGLVSWGPYWEHIKEGWSRRHENNLLFLFYDDMNKDLKQGIERVSKFLGKHYSSEEITSLEDHLKIDNIKNNKSVNFEYYKDLGILLSNEANFIRKGTSGGWRSYFDEELNDQADKWIQENLKSLDIKFPILK